MPSYRERREAGEFEAKKAEAEPSVSKQAAKQQAVRVDEEQASQVDE